MTREMNPIGPKSGNPLVGWMLRFCMLLTLLAASIPRAVDACALHFSTALPEAPLSVQLSSSDAIVAPRPGRDDPFRFTDIQVLEGQSIASGPPGLIDSGTRRLLRSEAGLAGVHRSERGLSSDHEVRRLIHRRTSTAERRKGRWV